jgi:GT2 family glycosyltransferase
VEEFIMRVNEMSEVKGCIDLVENGIVSGWVVSDELSEVSLFCGENNLGNLNELFYRQDIVDAGYSEGNSGFSLDASELLKSTSGAQLFSIQVDGAVITEKEFCLPTGTNYILNPFMELEGKFALKDTVIGSNHRIGIDFNSFIAPKGLQHSTGKYTRITFADSNNTKSLLEFSMGLDPSIVEESRKHPLEVSFVAKSSNPCNIHVRWLDDDDNCVLDVPILIDQDWALKTCVFDTELTERVRSGELRLVLRTKHYGRRSIDIAMVVLTENTSLFKTPVQEEKIQRKIDDSVYKGNLLQNGELTKWSKGVDFSALIRGQELADNWFVEMNKSNLGNVQIAVSIDNVGQDPLANSLQTKFGLRMRTKKLDGYARVICPLNSTSINIINYTLVMEIEATSLNKTTLIPRVYFIARNAYEDIIVMVVARKVTVSGRQHLSFNLSSYQIDQLLTRTGKMPVLALAIDLASTTDITVHSASFKVADFSSKEQPAKVNVTNEVMCFEDESITEQLHLLKGLDSWSTGEAITIDTNQAKKKNEPFMLEGNEFKKAIYNLTPHNMTRPSRHFPFIDIIIPVYNACDDVLLCLSSLIEKTDLAHRIIIVNDGDEERTTEMLQAFESSFNHVEILNNPENIGYTKSVNRGIKGSNAGWVIVLNSDTIVSEGWLGRLMNCALSSDKIGMVGPLSNAASWQSIPEIHDKNGDWHLNPLPEGMSVDHLSTLVEQHSIREYPEVGVINGFCQLINMELLDEIGLLDEIAFPVGYGEENDMCARAVKAGYKLLIADDTYVFHAKSKSFGHEQRKKLAKQGSEALKKKHPDVDWGQVTTLFRENSALNELRGNISLELKQFVNGEAQ